MIAFEPVITSLPVISREKEKMLGYLKYKGKKGGIFFVRCMSSDFAGSHTPPSGFGGRFVLLGSRIFVGWPVKFSLAQPLY